MLGVLKSILNVGSNFLFFSSLHVPVLQYAYFTHRDDHCKISDASQGLENTLILPGQEAEAQGYAATVQHLIVLLCLITLLL